MKFSSVIALFLSIALLLGGCGVSQSTPTTAEPTIVPEITQSPEEAKVT